MFERYSELARRALFHGRDDVSRLGGQSIETAHLLLGVTAVEDPFVASILGEVGIASIRAEVEQRYRVDDRVETSLEIPFEAGAHRVLKYALVEADDLQHSVIEPGHLILGLLREVDDVSAVLQRHGLVVSEVRQALLRFKSIG